MPARPIALLSLLSLAAALAGCGRDDARAVDDRSDPVIALALADPLMTDPDLASRNLEGLALTGEGVPSALVPAEEAGDEVRSAALADAAALLGGQVRPAPPALGNAGFTPGKTLLLGWQHRFATSRCADTVTWTFAWAARMPQWLPVYPRGHVQEALGAETPLCRARAIAFRSAVKPQDVVDFYATLAGKAGFSLRHGAEGEAQVLSGTKGASGFSVDARPGPEGMTAVELVSLGG